jgi:hypothetical protein
MLLRYAADVSAMFPPRENLVKIPPGRALCGQSQLRVTMRSAAAGHALL